MKVIFRTLFLVALVAMAGGCGEPKEVYVPTVDVNTLSAEQKAQMEAVKKVTGGLTPQAIMDQAATAAPPAAPAGGAPAQ